MKLITSLVAGTAVLALGGGLFAAQASADPTTPAPAPGATTRTDATRGAGVAWFYRALTDAQRRCLADANLQRPQGRLTDEQVTQLRQQVRAALASCDIQLPSRAADRDRPGFRWAGLSSEQQHCLADAELTRPLGRLTDVQRAAVRQSVVDTVKGCLG